jgi:hypothetical protein
VAILISNISLLKSKIDTANGNIALIQQQVTTLANQYTSLSSQISNVFNALSNQIDSLSIKTIGNTFLLNTLQTNYLNTQIKVDSILLQIQINNQLLTTNNANFSLIQTQLITLTNEYNNIITLLNQLIALLNNQSIVASLNSGLLAYYPFSGNVNDSSGNGNNATIVNSITYGTDHNGNPSAALTLNGGFGGGRVITNTSLFNFQYTNNYTLSFWFLDNGSSSGRLFSTENPEGNFRVATYGAGIYAFAFGGSPYVYDTVALYTWNHISYVYSNRTVKLYKNGILKSVSTDSSTQSLAYGTPFTIGSKAAASYDIWNGKIDEVRIYNREITAKEAQYLATH